MFTQTEHITPQGVPSPVLVFLLLRLHTEIFDGKLEDTAHHGAWALGLHS